MAVLVTEPSRLSFDAIRDYAERVGGNFDLDTVQGQNTFRALL